MKTLFPRGIVLFHEALINPGGAERLVVEEYRYLRAQGIATRLISFIVEPRALYGMDAIDIEILPRRNILHGIMRLRARLTELDPNLVIVASGQRDLYLATLLSKIPYLLHQHEAPYKKYVTNRYVLMPLVFKSLLAKIRDFAYGYRHNPMPPTRVSLLQRMKHEVLSFLDYFIIRKAFAVLVLSQRAAREVKMLYGREAISLRGALPHEIFTYKPKQSLKKKLGLDKGQVFLSISRLDPMKRLDVVIRAFSMISSRFDDVYLVIGGIGLEEKHLKRLTEELDLKAKVTFLGYVPEAELWDHYATCDIFICTDWTDFDIAPYEALAFQRRVVWSSEMETDKWLLQTGQVFVVEPTVEGIAEGMERALHTPNINCINSYDYLKQYKWDNYFAQVLKIASRCVQKNEYYAK